MIEEVSGDEMNANKTPNCDMHEALVSHLYGEATPEETTRVEAHIKECKACADEFSSFERVRGMLQKWQVEELPEMHFVKKEQAVNRSALSLLKELFTLTPLWGKALAGAAAALLILAVMGTNISIQRGGVSFSVSMFGGERAQSPGTTADNIDQVRAEFQTIVNSVISAREQQQRDALKLELASLETALQSAHEADLAKIGARIQQQRELIKSLERDIDRREGLALSDILFSEVTTRSGGTHGGE
jgi:Putative zinc-finger